MPPASRGFDITAVLDDRIERLERDLSAALDAVNAAPVALRARMTGGLRNEIAKLVNGVAADLAKPSRAGSLHPADAWARLHAKRTQVDVLLAECLSLVAGAEIRVPRQGQPGEADWRGSGSRLCRIADAMLDELVARTPMAGWDSFTVLGTAESFDYASRLIVVRFPNPTIWDLAATAHELGHYAARTISEFRNGRTRNVIDDLHDELDGAQSRWYWVEELFGDAFATWLLGPAYGFTCTTLSFDPLNANVVSESHPPDSVRVALIATVLEAFGDDTTHWYAQELAALWQRLVEVSEAAPGPAGPDQEPLVPDGWLKKMVELLGNRLPYARYATLPEAQRLAAKLGANAVHATTTLSDVLNAAWLARVAVPGRLGLFDVNRNGIAAAEKIIEGRTDAHVSASTQDGRARTPS